MKIAISSTSNMGKTTLIGDFLKEWPMYKLADNSYRDMLKAGKKINLNQEGDEASQTLIRDAFIDQAQKHSKDEFVIYDRCIFDNISYSLWLNSQGKVSDDYIKEQIPVIRESLKMYDIIFFIPILKNYDIPVVPSGDGTRDLDPVFRSEIDTIMKSLQKQYHVGKRVFFPKEDCPALVECWGTREQRIEMLKLYINKNGKVYGEEDTLIKLA